MNDKRATNKQRGAVNTSLLSGRVKAGKQYLRLWRQVPPKVRFWAILVNVLLGLSPALMIIGAGITIESAYSGAGFLPGLAVAAVGLLLQHMLSAAQLWVAAIISSEVNAHCSTKLMETCRGVEDLAALEHESVKQAIYDANNSLAENTYTPGEACAAVFALMARYVQLAAALALITLLTTPLAGLIGLAIALINRFGESFGFSLWASVMRRLTPQRRRMLYFRDTLTDPAWSRDVRKLQLLDWLQHRYTTESRIYHRSLWHFRRKVMGARFVLYAAISIVLGALFMVIALANLDATGEHPGAVAVLLQAVLQCVLFGVMFPECDLPMQYGREAVDAIERIERHIAGKATSKPAEQAKITRATGPAEIHLKSIGYSYDSDHQTVLRDVNLRLRKGEPTALVGLNGAGKSTLVKVLAGLYQPARGEVVVDGLPLGDRARWHSQIAVLFQDFTRYELSVRANVVMQSPEANDNDALVRECLQRVGLQRLIRDQFGEPEATLHADRHSIGLSGGEWQRLVLARALYAVKTGARLLVLDEPTSQLDARGESEFFEEFFELTAGVTTLIISHRFSSVRMASTIAVLDGGVITEQGSHDELIAREGKYAQMFAAQASQFGVME